MIKSLLTTGAVALLMSGTALAQSPPPMGGPVVVPPSDTSTTIRGNIAPDGSIHATTTQKHLDANGQVVTEKNSYRNGSDGSGESHSQTQFDPATGSVTKSTTTTEQR